MNELVDVDRWHRWLTSRRGCRRWQEWTDRYPSLAGWTPDALAHPRWSMATDRLQHDLVALAQGGDGDAALTLLVQLRPGLLRLVRGREIALGEARADACDEVRAVFNETLYRHPLDRRPERIAANLVLDTRQRLHRVRRHPVAPATDGGMTTWPEPDAVTPGAMLRHAIDRLPGSADSRAVTAEAAYRAWILEQSHTVIARELGLRPATVASRLHRLRLVVRQEWQAAA